MRAKAGELKIKWSKRERDIQYAWGGDGALKADGHMLHMWMYWIRNSGGQTFAEELVARGYDLKTLEFSIRKRTI